MVSFGEKNYYYLVAILLLVLLFDQQVVAPPPPPPANTPTHFLMVLQWSKAFCKNKALTKIKPECPSNYESELFDQFYIHGMWPKPTSGRLISEEFSFQVLVDLAPNDKKRLMTYWRSGMAAGMKGEGAILGTSSADLWAHEWKEHGQFQTLGQKEYFIFALDKYDSLSQIHTDVVKKFHTQKKVEVRISDIVQYIQVKHRVTVDISCLPYDTAGKTMLYEVYFNLTMNGQLQNLTDHRGHGTPCPVNTKAVFI